MTGVMSIRPLSDTPEALPELAALLRETWPDWYGPGGSGDAMADLRARSSAGLPLGWVAMIDGHAIGTVALDQTSYGAGADEGLWLIGLVTAPQARGRCVASGLVRHVMAQTPGPLFSTTKSAAGLLQRQGWQKLREIDEGWQVWRR